MLSLIPFVLRVLIVLCVTLSGKPMAATSSASGTLEVVSGVEGLPTKLTVVSASGAPTGPEKKTVFADAGTGVREDLAAVIAKGWTHSTIVAEGLRQEASHREAMTADFTRQLAELGKIYASKGYAEDSAVTPVIEAVVAALRQDLTYVDRFNTAARALSVDIVGYDIHANKMGEFWEGKLPVRKPGIIEGAINLLIAHGKTLITGKVPDGYAVDQTTITMLGDNSVSVFGNSKAPFLQMAILGLLAHGKEKKTFEELGKDLSDVMTYRGVAHTTNPTDIASLFSNLDPICRFRTDNVFLAIHAGYRYGPSDCSSWMTLITGTPAESRFTTGNLFFTAAFLRDKGQFSETGSGHQDIKDWLKTPIGKFLAGSFSPSGEFTKGKFSLVSIKDHTKDINAGCVWHRGGHTALVLGVLPDGAIATLGRNRNMPAMEGFGIQLFPYTSDTNIFEVNSYRKSKLQEKKIY